MTEENKTRSMCGWSGSIEKFLPNWADCSAELKRIGENFKALGTDMIDPPETLVIDQVSFNADVAITPRLLAQYSELVAMRADKRAELENFGPLPQFNAA
jgi:hypothetical protein